MAKTNKDAAFGLRAIGKVGQNRDNQGLGEYSISSGDTTQIFFQDAVSATAAGTIHQAAASEAFLLGSLNGVFYTDPTTSKPTFANNYPGTIAASDIKAFVADDPYERFEIQSNKATAHAQTDVFKNFNIEVTAGDSANNIAQQRQEYYAKQHAEKVEAADNDLMKEEHPSMPINIDRQSRVTFGGSKKS